MEVFNILSCNQGEECLNSVELAGYGSAKCALCRFAPQAVSSMSNFWKPIKKGMKHPVAEQEKLDKSRTRHEESFNKRQNVDRRKRKVLIKAERAERKTEQNFIKSTKNSGRKNKDGDHVVANGSITLDTKLQSTREEPVVHLHELRKIESDAARAGNDIGCLVIRNKHGVGVVVLSEESFARLIARIT
jgi:hypothetical protein